jgi:acyl-CoA synthetase (AMP-forming)/AMP-acid ligase II
VCPDAPLAHAELRTRARNVAAALGQSGLRGGERVILVLPNESAFAVAAIAIWQAGGVVVPMDWRAPAEQVARIARDCQATAIACDGIAFARLEPRLREIPSLRFVVVKDRRPGSYLLHVGVLAWDGALACDAPARALEPEPRDLALLVYTSGSTGTPKGVMHSHESLLSSLAFTRDHEGLRRDDRVLIAFPLYHLFSLRVLLSHLLVGAAVVLAPDILAGLRRAAETRPSALILVPAACALLARRFAPSLAALAPLVRRVSIGSAAISPPLLEEMQRLLPGARIFIPYGMTEARIGFLEPVPGRAERRLAAVDPNLELRVVDAEGRPLREGVGEIVLRGRALMLGYWHNRDAENRALRAQGLHTRDLAEVAANGERFLVGRLDDVVNVGGEKVFPAEVEAALLTHPAVRDARVSGAPDPQGVRGQIVAASVVLAESADLDAEAILAHCRARLEPYKVPSRIEAVAEIPRNEMGKVVRLARTP